MYFMSLDFKHSFPPVASMSSSLKLLNILMQMLLDRSKYTEHYKGRSSPGIFKPYVY